VKPYDPKFSPFTVKVDPPDTGSLTALMNETTGPSKVNPLPTVPITAPTVTVQYCAVEVRLPTFSYSTVVADVHELVMLTSTLPWKHETVGV
jgi:hypothetical protein